MKLAHALAALALALIAQTGPAGRLAGRAIGPTPMLEDLRHLCDRIGGRPTGAGGRLPA